ncbi:unnamed protein product [Polarella glacialis]|uniref:Methyltransferase type 11 domain-containing protein n=1 Tax=Polarella glacialis TaxID=89957 RepID=A0A813LSX8_POLGL|nr:unnamed protein product [Polarella glacialis]
MACSCTDGLCKDLHTWGLAVRRRINLFRGDSSRSWLGRQEYWDAAYASGRYHENYEWNQSCDVVWPFLAKMLGKDCSSRVLHVGCGNSRLSRMIYDAGFANVTNVDYSPVVIDMMRQKEPDLTWLRADCSKAGALGNDVYDFCVDKGAIDSLFEAGSESMEQLGRAMIAEVHRVLRPGGQYLVISNGGVGNEALSEKFASVQCESIEGYSCDLYYKLIVIVICTK